MFPDILGTKDYLKEVVDHISSGRKEKINIH